MCRVEIREIADMVYNRLGGGLSECAYQRAMELELESRGHGCIREYYLNETYVDSRGRSHVISQLRADLVVFDLNCIIELKSVSCLNHKDRLQISRYKKLSKCPSAFLINFGYSKLEFESI
tara:strand:- start:536 stop:898 length:363 start_codon:yes stop_codon:yes gene_type:complete